MTIDTAQATIMIIDDEPENLNVLGEMLRQAGWDVRAFPRGEMALAAAREELPDVVLLDIRMPGMDGYEVCSRFKADERLRQIPIVFLSAFAEAPDKVRAFEAGGVDYVTKPFAAIEVLARTRTHLAMRRHNLHLEQLVAERVQALAEAHRRLRIWDDAKNQWLNVLAHEMRTPLNGVIGITELLFMDSPVTPDTENLRHHYEISRIRIEKLMDDATTLSHIDVAADDFAVGRIRLTDVLQQALAETARLAPASPVEASVAAVQEVQVAAEPELLRRAFIDLLLTATYCVNDGDAIRFETKVAAGQAKIELITKGLSLPAEALDTFFEIGGQRELLKGGGDLGLGTALAGRIIRLFNGAVSVRNSPDQGIVMSISLPVVEAQSA